MIVFEETNVNIIIYASDFLFIASLATILIKLKLEKSCLGFSAKTQGVYGVVLCTRNIDIFFAEGSVGDIIYCVIKKIANISCIIYIVFKIKSLRNSVKNNTQCNCNQDSFWVEALVIPCILITAILHHTDPPEVALWSFSIYLETVAMLPQFYLIHVRGKGDTYLPAYISLMALYTLTGSFAFCVNAFYYHEMTPVWPACKCFQLAFYFWYVLIPREPILPVANCQERKRKTTVFMRQQSMLAQSLLQKNTSSSDLQIFTVNTPCPSDSGSSTPGKNSLESSGQFYIGDSPPASPCIKFNSAFEAETIKIKAPRLTLKQLKGTTKLNRSMPNTPESIRKFGKSESSKHLGLNRSVSSGNFGFSNYTKKSNSINKPGHKFGVSLPSTPEPLRKIVSQKNQNNSISELHQKTLSRSLKIADTSLPNSPELRRKNELILQAHPSHSLYRSLSHFPIYYNEFIPTLPSVEGSLPNTPINSKKSNVTSQNPSLDYSPSPLKSENSTHKPKRPVLPRFILTTPDLLQEKLKT